MLGNLAGRLGANKLTRLIFDYFDPLSVR